jgi:hypothetical protein
MTDSLDWLRTLGINGATLGIVSLTDLELVLKIVLLSVTIVWTVVKVLKLLKDDN